MFVLYTIGLFYVFLNELAWFLLSKLPDLQGEDQFKTQMSKCVHTCLKLMEPEINGSRRLVDNFSDFRYGIVDFTNFSDAFQEFYFRVCKTAVFNMNKLQLS